MASSFDHRCFTRCSIVLQNIPVALKAIIMPSAVWLRQGGLDEEDIWQIVVYRRRPVCHDILRLPQQAPIFRRIQPSEQRRTVPRCSERATAKTPREIP